jgi:MFS family permease
MRIDRWFRGAGDAAQFLRTGTRSPVGRGAARWTMLASPDFRRLWLVGFVISAVRWLEMLAIGVFVYQHTGSAFDVALMTLLRMLPLALFGAVIGALAERVERRKTLIGVVLLMLTTSLSLAVLAHAGILAIWHLALASFCNGVAWATDNPVRRVMIGEVVGSEQMGSAMSLDVGGNNASRMLGPTLGGALLAYAGISGAFTASVLFYAVGLAAAIGLQHRNAHVAAAVGSVLARIVEGFVLVRRDPRLIGILLVTVIYNVFGWPFTAMIPVIGNDNLGLGASAIGVLASMDGIGAFFGVVAIALYVRPAHYRLL